MGKACGLRVPPRREIHRGLVGEPEGRGLTAQMCEDNVELDSKGTGWEGVDWILFVR